MTDKKKNTDIEKSTVNPENINYQSGYVAVIGRPNVGKSTLMNSLLGQKLSITSPKPQTTRHRIHGIHTTENYQICFIDTPGMHLGETKSINKYMNRAAYSAFDDVDVVMFVVEAGKWTREDQAVADKCKHLKCPLIVLVNKIDKFKKKQDLFPFFQKLNNNLEFDQLIPVSAYKNSGLDIVEKEILKIIPVQEAIFSEDYITDRSTRFLISEIVREKLMRELGDEVPYGSTVEIEQFKFNDEENRWIIHALILVERQGQKQIVIGKKGELIKRIGTHARKDIMNLLDARVHLELWVKVKENWSDDERALASLGYTDEIT
ncbi:MAG TPA: GTPase Era [Thiomicrospira sp.]|jgi:GTP-binding protein Era|nr:GTPase Era [Thiomicrospira sp.]